MGRKTKAQRDRAKKRTVTTPDGSEVSVPRKTKSQFPANAKQPLRPRQPRANTGSGNPIIDAMKAPDAAEKVQEIVKGLSNIGKNINPDARAAASARMKSVLDLLNATPPPILDQLRGMGIEVTVVHNVRDEPKYDTVVMKMSDLEEADRKIASRGTLYEQVWKGSES